MTRRCSHCSNNGHNSRTCPTRTGAAAAGGGGGGVKLFGVRLTEGGSMIMKKSASMGCISHYASLSSSSSASPAHHLDSPHSGPLGDNDEHDAEGYASDDPNHASCSANRRTERKKGIPWTEEEHRMFLVGLQKLGKGDWRGIARKYVVSRTPTQVASHAQKYFIRQTNVSRRKRRSSLFDMVPDVPMDQALVTEDQTGRSPPESDNTNNVLSLDLNLERNSMTTETVSENSTREFQEPARLSNIPPLIPTYYPFYPGPYPCWPSGVGMTVKNCTSGKTHEVLKPTPVLAKDPNKTDELMGLSKLSLGEVGGSLEPSALSSKLLSDSSSRQSAFHANPAVAGSDLSQNNGGNAIHAV